ncbi:hypothetical protein EIP86_006228 [Pleurotus ostreatoroseus]|nr:hypothetical protein EIP86_006228 [Pleurotus ostreatoroseus]
MSGTGKPTKKRAAGAAKYFSGPEDAASPHRTTQDIATSSADIQTTPPPLDIQEASSPSEHSHQHNTSPTPNISFAEHMMLTDRLFCESRSFFSESSLYHVYNWTLAFFAHRDTNKEDGLRIAVWPQPRLEFTGPLPKSDTEPELSEYDPRDEPPNSDSEPETRTEDTAPATSTQSVQEQVPENKPRRSTRLRVKNLKKAREASAATPPQGKSSSKRKMRPPVTPQDSSDRGGVPPGDVSILPTYDVKESLLQDAKARYPDFIVSMWRKDRPMRIHSLIENKRLYTMPEEQFGAAIPIPDDAEGKKDRDKKISNAKIQNIALTFMNADVQILEAAACAFKQYPHHKTLTYLVGVGHYFRTMEISRNIMPSPDFNWRSQRRLLRKSVQKIIDRSVFYDVFHILNHPQNDDYNPNFHEYWDEALARALLESREDPTLDPGLQIGYHSEDFAVEINIARERKRMENLMIR